VPVDREETLKKADKLLKQGKLAAAIEEYVRLVEDKPGDWNTVNTLGDLYVKAGETERAAEQFTRAADHLYGEGFFPRASAVYKKVLKVRSNDDHARWQLADIAGRNGLSLDARSHYGRLILDRRAAGDEQGAVDCLIRLGQLDDANVDARRVAASALVERGEQKQAARLVLSIADVLMKEGRLNEAVDALKEAAPLDPENQEIRDKLAAAAPVEEPPPVDDISPAVEEPTAPAETLTVLEASEPEPLVEPEPEPAPVEGVIEPVAAVAEVAAPEPVPTASPDDALPLETFFEELRGKVARDQESRARELLDRGLEQLADNKMAEAIASFEEASRMPAMRFEASAHLARIFLARSDLQAAVDWMERALEAPAPAPEDRLEIMYDLADTLARQGESSRAMALFMEVDSESSGYRDVRERIAHLSHTEIGNP
jgi:tetratricopeptide (TPR) repeat protein